MIALSGEVVVLGGCTTIQSGGILGTMMTESQLTAFTWLVTCEKLPKLQHTMKIDNLNITLGFAQKHDTGPEKARAEQLAEEPLFPFQESRKRRGWTEKLVTYLEMHKHFFDLYRSHGWLSEFEIREYTYPRTPVYLSSESSTLRTSALVPGSINRCVIYHRSNTTICLEGSAGTGTRPALRSATTAKALALVLPALQGLILRDFVRWKLD